MERTIESGRIYHEAKKEGYRTVYVPEFVSADSAEELAEEITVRRIKNGQSCALIHFLSATEAFIEFAFNIKE